MATSLHGRTGQRAQHLVVLEHVQDIVIAPILHQFLVAAIVLDRSIK